MEEFSLREKIVFQPLTGILRGEWGVKKIRESILPAQQL
jgi:hypothetical protein